MADHDDGYTWHQVAHCCRVCFGRVLRRPGLDGKRIYRCSNCGLEREGHDSRVICACGIRLKTGADAGIRCVAQTKPTSECPSLIVAEQQGAVKT